MSEPILLVTGGSGRLGSEIKKLHPEGLYPTHAEMDITDFNSIIKYLSDRGIKSNTRLKVIHCAAFTSVKGCEEDKSRAWKTNVEGTRNIVAVLDSFQIDKFVYIGSPCIFSGETGEYDELSIPDPKNYYGLTKLIAEWVIRQKIKRHLIVRTNFVKKAKWEHPKAFSDRFGSYLWAHQVAEGLLELMERQDIFGTYHLVGTERYSMFKLAKRLPENDSLEQTTLEEHYSKHPTPHLTRDMTMISWKIPPMELE